MLQRDLELGTQCVLAMTVNPLETSRAALSTKDYID